MTGGLNPNQAAWASLSTLQIRGGHGFACAENTVVLMVGCMTAEIVVFLEEVGSREYGLGTETVISV